MSEKEYKDGVYETAIKDIRTDIAEIKQFIFTFTDKCSDCKQNIDKKINDLNKTVVIGLLLAILATTIGLVLKDFL